MMRNIVGLCLTLCLVSSPSFGGGSDCALSESNLFEIFTYINEECRYSCPCIDMKCSVEVFNDQIDSCKKRALSKDSCEEMRRLIIERVIGVSMCNVVFFNSKGSLSIVSK